MRATQRAHNLKPGGSNPSPATEQTALQPCIGRQETGLVFLIQFLSELGHLAAFEGGDLNRPPPLGGASGRCPGSLFLAEEGFINRHHLLNGGGQQAGAVGGGGQGRARADAAVGEAAAEIEGAVEVAVGRPLRR